MALAPLVVFIVWIGVQPRFFLDRMSGTLDRVTAGVIRAEQRKDSEARGQGSGVRGQGFGVDNDRLAAGLVPRCEDRELAAPRLAANDTLAASNTRVAVPATAKRPTVDTGPTPLFSGRRHGGPTPLFSGRRHGGRAPKES
jgi:hypothetical protein